jgi:ATP-binding cassette subfamily C protein CydC
VLHDGPIWLLDEPTEGLDGVTEAAVLKEILAITARRTLLLVTHRPAALDRMDAVVVMEKGRIVERGTHRELLAAGGRYGALWRR